MKHYWDGFLSFLCAVLTAAICGGPTWFTYLAVEAGIAPRWAYGFAGALGALGLLLTFAFLRKARLGISPTRDRRRR